MSGVTIRKALPDDAAALLCIYSPYVTGTAVSFEYEPPSVAEFRSRIVGVTEKYPYLVAEADGAVAGYAYAHAFHERAAYHRSAELSIYIDRAYHGRGIGRMLYAELERLLADMGVTNLYAGIAVPRERDDPYLTDASLAFHKRIGFEPVAHFHGCGEKFGRLYDVVYAEKLI